MKAEIMKCGKINDRVKPISFKVLIKERKMKTLVGTIEVNYLEEKIYARFEKALSGNARVALLKEIFYQFGIKNADKPADEIVTYSLVDVNEKWEYQTRSVIGELVDSKRKFESDKTKERVLNAVVNSYTVIEEKVKASHEKIELQTFTVFGSKEAKRYEKILTDYLEEKNIKGTLTEVFVNSIETYPGSFYPYYLKQYVFYPARKYDIN